MKKNSRDVIVINTTVVEAESLLHALHTAPEIKGDYAYAKRKQKLEQKISDAVNEYLDKPKKVQKVKLVWLTNIQNPVSYKGVVDND